MFSENNLPLISVIMPVFNGDRFLKAAIESILTQSFKAFEFIIIDDGSTDDSFKIIQSFEDTRIFCIQNSENKGLVFSLNYAINIAKGKYVARFDADDIALSNRLEKQYHYLEQNPSIGLLGTNIRFINNNKLANTMKLPSSDIEAKCRLLFNTTFVHPTVMIPTKILKENLYNPTAFPAEDYELWVRIAQQYEIANLNETLLYCRLHESNIHLNTQMIVLESVSAIYKHIFEYTFDYTLSNQQIEIHQVLTLYKTDFSETIPIRIQSWVQQLMKMNEQKNIFEQRLFKRQLAKIWFKYIYNYIRYGKQNINFFKSKLIFHVPVSLLSKMIVFSIFNTLKIGRYA